MKGSRGNGLAMARTEGFVLDGSVAMAWYFKDESNEYASAVQDSLGASRAVVPSLWPLEVANTILVGERRKRSNQAQAAAWTGLLGALPITVDLETSTRTFTEILNLGRDRNLSAYAAAYLELAMRRGLPLATLDEKLKAAATAVGVGIYLAD